MSQTEFKKAGSMDKPGPVGRWARVLSGLLCVYFLYSVVAGYPGIVSTEFPVVFSLWIGVLFCLHGLPHVLKIGFGFHFGKWPRWFWLVIVAGTVAFSFFERGTLWGPEVGLAVFVLVFFVLVMLAPALVLSGIIATPG